MANERALRRLAALEALGVRANEPPRRPMVTVAVLRDVGPERALELEVMHLEPRCRLELLNLSHGPGAPWNEALRIQPKRGENWFPNDSGGRLVLSEVWLHQLHVREQHALLIRQVRLDDTPARESEHSNFVVRRSAPAAP